MARNVFGLALLAALALSVLQARQATFLEKKAKAAEVRRRPACSHRQPAQGPAWPIHQHSLAPVSTRSGEGPAACGQEKGQGQGETETAAPQAAGLSLHSEHLCGPCKAPLRRWCDPERRHTIARPTARSQG